MVKYEGLDGRVCQYQRPMEESQEKRLQAHQWKKPGQEMVRFQRKTRPCCKNDTVTMEDDK